jgi:VIT1/CCC1 family predicted Fe2+/Mn2+ transporter
VVTRDGISHHAHEEGHLSDRAAILRAGVLGANDGLLSTASLVVGVAAADPSRAAVLTAGIAGLVAGALSMAVGEWSSVSSQRDAEEADLAKERHELARAPEAERHELAAIYRRRGLSDALADAVADELSRDDPLRHHARDELGLDPDNLSRPEQAAMVSAASFAVGAMVPIVAVAIVASAWRAWAGVVSALIGLAVLGSLGARLGGADWRRPTRRVLIGGAVALAVSYAIGSAVGAVV